MLENNPLASGQIIDERYQVIGVIGEGAMGTVVRCRDSSLRNSNVVLKFLKQDYVQDAKQFERFKNEALLMRELNHPNIVHVYDLRCFEGTSHFITMEFIEGSSLKAVMEDLPDNSLPFKDALKILKDIASGMSYAHQKGIIHRDLKPDNVLLSSDGEVKLTDFGLGKTLVIEEDLTDLGEAVGTPHYMSPEQLRGLKLDKRCDIYSFGIMAYELVTGKKPYSETNYLKLAAKHLNEPIPKIISKDRNIPAWYNNFIAKCCAKERDQRFQSFQEIFDVLQSFIASGKVNGFGLSKDINKRAYWLMKWHFEKWNLKNVFYIFAITLLCLLFVIILGRGNPTIKILYGPSVINFEEFSKIDLTSFKKFAFGPALAELMNKNRNSLFQAVKNKNLEGIEILIQSGIDPSLRDDEGKTALSIAASLGDIATIKIIAQVLNHEQINFLDYMGDSALMLAVRNNKPEAARFLLKLGANPNLSNKLNITPLAQAVLSENLENVELLLKNGAIPDSETNEMIKKSKNKALCDHFKKVSAK